MNIKLSLPAAAILALLLPTLAMAQDIPRWSVGAVGVMRTSPFEAQADSPRREREVDFLGFPYISYRGDKFFMDGTGVGAHVIGGPTSQSPVTADIVVSARRRPGTSRDKIRADAGVRLSYQSSFGTFDLGYLHDVTDSSDGSEITAGYRYTFQDGPMSLTPGIRLIRQSSNMAGYLWGVTQAQHDRMVEKGKVVLPVYELSESVVNVEAGLTATYGLGGRWALMGFASITRLDKAIRRNPGIDEDFMATMGGGIVYSF